MADDGGVVYVYVCEPRASRDNYWLENSSIRSLLDEISKDKKREGRSLKVLHLGKKRSHKSVGGVGVVAAVVGEKWLVGCGGGQTRID